VIYPLYYIFKFKTSAIINSSVFFNPEWYRETYPDVENWLNPAFHYAWIGWQELRNPGPDFNSATYFIKYQDNMEKISNPLIYHERIGKKKSFFPNHSWEEVTSLHCSSGYKQLDFYNESINWDDTDSGKIRYPKKILFIGHDASLTGAPMVLLHILRWLQRNTSIETYLILLKGGPLYNQYREVSRVWCLNASLHPRIDNYKSFCENPDLIYGNTVVSASLYAALKEWGIPIITHVHELEGVINQTISKQVMEDLVINSSKIIAVSSPVAENLVSKHGYPKERIKLIHDFISTSDNFFQDKKEVRITLNIPLHCKLIIGCGTADWRKGTDLFIEVAKRVIEKNTNYEVFFIWIGKIIDDNHNFNPVKLVKKYGLDSKILFPGLCDDPRPYYNAADIFLLTSREDPFPLVVLEACDYELPIICFDNSGGMPAYVKNGPGFVVPFEDVGKMAEVVSTLLEDENLRLSVGKTARTRLHTSHVSEIAVPQILHECLTIDKKF